MSRSTSPIVSLPRRSDPAGVADSVGSNLHQHANGGWRGIPDAHFLRLQNSAPTLRVEVCFINNARNAVRERSNDAIRCSRHPSRICCAPEDILVMEIKRKLTGNMVCDNSAVDMDGAFGSSRRTAREMQQSEIFWRRRPDGVGVPSILHQLKIILGVRHIRRLMIASDQHNMLEKWERGPECLHLSVIEQLGRDQYLCLTNRQACPNGFRTKCRE